MKDTYIITIFWYPVKEYGLNQLKYSLKTQHFACVCESVFFHPPWH